MNASDRNRRLEAARRSEALSSAESICKRLRDIEQGLSQGRFSSCEYGDMARTLKDIEDRLYGKGEYAPENVASVR